MQRCNDDPFAGDLDLTFAWDVGALGKGFTLAPLRGAVPAGKDVVVTVTLCPVRVASDLTGKALCTVAGLPEPLALLASGACINLEAATGTLTFECPTRSRTTTAFTLSNPSPVAWRIQPTVQGGPFTVPDHVAIPANGSAEIPVTFAPLQMAGAAAPHTGSVFAALPDGGGLLYQLSGVALEPPADGRICRCAPLGAQWR